MSQSRSSVAAYTGVAEAALASGHRTYSGTVAATESTPVAVQGYVSVAQAALALGHRTYSGTIAATERVA